MSAIFWQASKRLGPSSIPDPSVLGGSANYFNFTFSFTSTQQIVITILCKDNKNNTNISFFRSLSDSFVTPQSCSNISFLWLVSFAIFHTGPIKRGQLPVRTKPIENFKEMGTLAIFMNWTLSHNNQVANCLNNLAIHLHRNQLPISSRDSLEMGRQIISITTTQTWILSKTLQTIDTNHTGLPRLQYRSEWTGENDAHCVPDAKKGDTYPQFEFNSAVTRDNLIHEVDTDFAAINEFLAYEQLTTIYPIYSLQANLRSTRVAILKYGVHKIHEVVRYNEQTFDFSHWIATVRGYGSDILVTNDPVVVSTTEADLLVNPWLDYYQMRQERNPGLHLPRCSVKSTVPNVLRPINVLNLPPNTQGLVTSLVGCLIQRRPELFSPDLFWISRALRFSPSLPALSVFGQKRTRTSPY
ncbi:uncharacterized protein BDR25DRAFT_363734 [Lindgomyces ingoldianus]|uniref:Uncharacterized protein n=1 Tax=Lindgomyces ingoldianus TaxID=673940 RepID=A0ACB6Q8I1_9PLEO|nr:uncharacterized protein BDR25DRAFT_363734 [Lindgomyces ingoldianus]KAF2462672.1 hypothetical protein BDR25DRAFT_363734 [Lindgomyces ingoldianus]